MTGFEPGSHGSLGHIYHTVRRSNYSATGQGLVSLSIINSLWLTVIQPLYFPIMYGIEIHQLEGFSEKIKSNSVLIIFKKTVPDITGGCR